METNSKTRHSLEVGKVLFKIKKDSKLYKIKKKLNWIALQTRIYKLKKIKWDQGVVQERVKEVSK